MKFVHPLYFLSVPFFLYSPFAMTVPKLYFYFLHFLYPSNFLSVPIILSVWALLSMCVPNIVKGAIALWRTGRKCTLIIQSIHSRFGASIERDKGEIVCLLRCSSYFVRTILYLCTFTNKISNWPIFPFTIFGLYLTNLGIWWS